MVRVFWFPLPEWLRLLLLVRLLAYAVAMPAPQPAEQDLLAYLSTAAMLPDDDPFYHAPSTFIDNPPGTILRHRVLPGNITLDNKNPIKPKAAWQLLYRSQNSVGAPSVNVVTVIEPFNAKPKDLLSYSYFSDAAYNGCNPSVTLQVGTREDNTFNQLQTAILVEALSLGYYVSVADFGGIQAAFSSGLQAGYATLDSLRAVYQSGNITGIDSKPITTLHGYSSGAQAVGWATELHPTYAPELEIAGAAFGGLVPNLSALLEMPIYQSGERAFLGPPVILGLSHDYANLSSWLDDNLLPNRSAEYHMGERECIDGNTARFAKKNLGLFFRHGYRSIFDEVPMSVVRSTGLMGERSTPTIPWYLYHAAGDDVSPQNLTDRVVQKHCANGADILYERNPLPLNHRYECIFGITGAYRWMRDRHEGKPVKRGCSTVNVSAESLKGTVQSLLVKGLLHSLYAYLGWDIGPDTPKVRLAELRGEPAGVEARARVGVKFGRR
ncbi:LIP-domain-containing protein [Trichodelitschia bisporula]|uniref:LIP-domain-containing protein n=1 Tax=Trichodelitschia bisporula TaxID=703511 RepID=A0A6G1HPB9_9PEZI|nr:LIP-domain-containing protein [Trichodelitschia bisporula]